MNRSYDQLAPPLKHFVKVVTEQIEREVAETALLQHVSDAMRLLVSEDNWLEPAYTEPDRHYYQQYLLYADPRDRMSVVSFVWGPGQSTPIHDHTVWGVIGMLRGSEFDQAYTIGEDGRARAVAPEKRLFPGQVGLVSPSIGDVHAVRNAHDDQVSISIHAYGGNIGKINRHVFPVDGAAVKDFVSGYAKPSLASRIHNN